jgi:hypothetical protein
VFGKTHGSPSCLKPPTVTINLPPAGSMILKRINTGDCCRTEFFASDDGDVSPAQASRTAKTKTRTVFRLLNIIFAGG